MLHPPKADFPDDTVPANSTLLLDMIADIGTNRFEYIYDMGDHWSHRIKIVKPMPAVPGIAYPLLIDAIGRCPPEDSGGPPGYMEMLEALRDPAHANHAEAIERLGRNFNATTPIAPSSRKTWPPWRN